MFNALLAAMLLQASGAASDACSAVVAPPAEMSGWASPRPLNAGRTAARATMLTPGVAISARLPSTRDVRYAVRPEKPGGSVSYGGVFAFTVTTPGRYRVALGSGAWIDVLANGKPATSVAHGHGPACTGIRKMVDFDLAAGRYVLQVAGNGTADLPLMVTKLPA
ncbi:homogentisate 1,2-dioxygenase [uncultured Sphingomonas sp.]|uniref:homogentisate 1,2-dioxygenase n=1 Tax=uncultured Sphingomonas sp. TaxID=158754 RepID=UPI0030DC692D